MIAVFHTKSTPKINFSANGKFKVIESINDIKDIEFEGWISIGNTFEMTMNQVDALIALINKQPKLFEIGRE